MKRAMMIVFAVALAAGVLPAQTPLPQAPSATQEMPASTSSSSQNTSPHAGTPAQTGTPEQNASRIAPGSIIPVRLAKTVDAKKAKQGDEVIGTVPGDLKATSGQVIVPKDTKVVGHITEAQKRSKEQKESQLGIAFDHMQMRNGQAVQIPMSIQAIVAPPNRTNNASPENQPSPPPSGTTTMSPAGGDRGGVMGGNPATPTGPPSTETAPTDTQAQSNPSPHITENTKGVVGIPNLTLAPTPGATSGSVVTSEKNNVKLEDGTLMLLRVGPSPEQNQQAPQTQQSPQQK